MHYYGQRIRRTDGMHGLKLEPGAKCAECHTFADMRPVFQRVEDAMRVLGFPLEDILAVSLVLREAGANAVRHGNEHDEAKRVFIRYLVTHDAVVVEVEDEGPGFDPTEVPNPFAAGASDRFRRLGLFLMCAYAQWVHFNVQGNRVTLGRCRSSP